MLEIAEKKGLDSPPELLLPRWRVEAKLLRGFAPWCNWQHKGFWFLYSRFES